MTDNRKKELEAILDEKLSEFLKSNVPGVTSVLEYNRMKNYIDLEVSEMLVTKLSIDSYISSYISNTYSVSVYITTAGNESGFVLSKLYSYSKDIKTDEELEEFFASSKIDEYFESFKDDENYKYLTDEEFRSRLIKEYTLNELKTFENLFNELLKHVGGKKLLSILAPLNSLVTYGGDFESVRDLVNHISNILKENRELKARSHD